MLHFLQRRCVILLYLFQNRNNMNNIVTYAEDSFLFLAPRNTPKKEKFDFLQYRIVPIKTYITIVVIQENNDRNDNPKNLKFTYFNYLII